MVLQYLVLVPAHMDERPILRQDRLTRAIGYPAYVAAVALAEVPGAILQTCLLMTVTLWTCDLNTDSLKVLYAFLGLTTGVLAWQACIHLCTSISDDQRPVHTIIFLLLGGGFLFGGIIIPKSLISPLFTWVYYSSVPALTTRALIFNDLYCCYMEETCSDALDRLQDTPSASVLFDLIRGRSAWSDELTSLEEMSENDCEPLEVGKAALRVLEMENFNLVMCAKVMLSLVILARLGALAVLSVREYMSLRLRHIRKPSSHPMRLTPENSTLDSRFDAEL
uniref:ABC-2 type transporter transmembrane domain-containing protein n=1 Tax=Octactis speculum TaxID=3111310 RepID=A0A7S2FDV1_9STRA|mmetsp:Transcript_20856/g.28351  ORF Transcript_20856/g.28351 Transcript_20856/m.28351 type:complete len:280 (+) Transcript_20856:39-878(+)